MSLAIVGSRNFQDYECLRQKVNELINSLEKPISTIVSGGAQGADQLAERFAKEHQLEIVVFEADWDKYGLRAGPLRNTQIVAAADHLIAFPSKTGRGTQDSIRKARAKGIPVTVHWIKIN